MISFLQTREYRMKEKILEKYKALKARGRNYYKDAFLKLTQENKTTFNLAAFVFGVCWMIYRRMWLSAIAYVITTAILMIVASFICVQPRMLNQLKGRIIE